MSVRSLKPFTPTRETPADLAARTVGRESLIEVLIDRLATAATTPDRTHSLIVGSRGAGKTHLVEVVLYRMALRPEASRLIVARLAEDVVGVTDARDLLVEIVDSIDASRSGEARSFGRTGDLGAIEDLISEIAGERTVVLVIENLHRLFDMIGLEGQRALRSWVETSRQVVLMATTPLLSEATADRDAPWFGSFTPSYLGDLSPEEGQRLLIELHRHDPELSDYLASDQALRRLRALEHLAGGSPRLWVIAAMCVTIESLDELVPAVEDLLDSLVPYYQERLWDLSPLEQKLIKAIAQHDTTISVRELAEFVGEEQRTVASTLRRLEEVGWVLGKKITGHDQRLTFYELREPLAKYHFDYRSTDRRSLQLIVDVLRVWFDPAERLRALHQPNLGQNAARHLAGSLDNYSIRADRSYRNRSVEELVSTARLWESGSDDLGSADLGALILNIVDQVRKSVTATGFDSRADITESIGTQLRELAGNHGGLGSSDVALLSLIEAMWNGGSDPTETMKRVNSIDTAAVADRVGLLIRRAAADLAVHAGEYRSAVGQYEQISSDAARTFGAKHPDTFNTRHNLAGSYDSAGRFAEALELYEQVLADQVEVLGPKHPDTLNTRHNLALSYYSAGRIAEAFELLEQVVADTALVLGEDHPRTRRARANLAIIRAEAGDDEALPSVLRKLLRPKGSDTGT